MKEMIERDKNTFIGFLYVTSSGRLVLTAVQQ